MRRLLVSVILCIASTAHAQTMIEVETPPAAPPPTLPMPPPPVLVEPDGFRLVVHALERNDRHARNRALIAAGSTLLGAGYSASLILGALTYNTYGDCTESGVNSASAALFAPIIGPFISGPLSGSVAWAVPVMLVDGVAQVAGLGMIIAGARSEHKLSLSPYFGANGIGLSLRRRM